MSALNSGNKKKRIVVAADIYRKFYYAWSDGFSCLQHLVSPASIDPMGGSKDVN